MIIRPGQLTIPLDVDATFGRPGPLVVEVGFGDGRYLTHLGTAFPEWNLFGVEVSLGSIWRAYRRMLREHIDHVRLFRGNAWFIVRDVIAPGTMHRIYVNFPDPWPRRKHLKNRLLRAPFFELISTRLEEGGGLFLTTDHEEYFGFAVDEAEKTGLFDVRHGSPPQATLKTKYALKWQEQEKRIFHAEFLKQGESTPRQPIIERQAMQHAMLSGDLDSVGSFSKQVQEFDGGHVIVLEGYRDLSGAGLLFKVVVEEPDLRQEVLVQAWQKPEGVFVSLQPFGDPLTTRGVREAVRSVVAWLESQGLEMKESWI